MAEDTKNLRGILGLDRIPAIVTVLVLLSGIAGCGGGGGGGSDTPVLKAPEVSLDYGIRTLVFSWPAVEAATHYKLLENPDGTSGYTQVGDAFTENTIKHEIPLVFRVNASYIIQACDADDTCLDSDEIFLAEGLIPAIGYIKASNPDENDQFGFGLALSGDGNTLVVGAPYEDSGATGISGDESDNSADDAGAAYIFIKSDSGTWVQQAYIKASNTDAGDRFGWAVALSEDGRTLAVTAPSEDSAATGINGDEYDDTSSGSGAAYVFTRDNYGNWLQEAYIKPIESEGSLNFGNAVALSADGNTLAVGAYRDRLSATGINDEPSSPPYIVDSGSAYVYSRDNSGNWAQQAYIKASDPGYRDYFGYDIALSADGNVLAVGSYYEDGGNPADETDNSIEDSGAVYVYTRDSDQTWTQQAYIKASNIGEGDNFGYTVALSGDGKTLAVGALYEDSSTSGIDTTPDDLASDTGAVYVFTSVDTGHWSQQAYIKVTDGTKISHLGKSLALSMDGNILAIGTGFEHSLTTGVQESYISASNESLSGAVFMFTRDPDSMTWSPGAYVKAPNTGKYYYFGESVSLSYDGQIMAVGSSHESNNAAGVGGNQDNGELKDSGAVYLY